MWLYIPTYKIKFRYDYTQCFDSFGLKIVTIIIVIFNIIVSFYFYHCHRHHPQYYHINIINVIMIAICFFIKCDAFVLWKFWTDLGTEMDAMD